MMTGGSTGGLLKGLSPSEGSPEEKWDGILLSDITVVLSAEEQLALNNVTLPSLRGEEPPIQWTDTPVSLDRLRNVLDILIAETNQTHAVLQAKAALAAAFCRYVETCGALSFQRQMTVDKEKKTTHSFLVWAAFGVLATFWVIRDSISVVMGLRDILPIGLLSPLPFSLISSLAVLITAGLLYFMELRFFKKAIGAESHDFDIVKQRADQEMMVSVSRMNSRLFNLDVPRRLLDPLISFATLLNSDAEKTKKKYSGEYPETRIQSWSWFAVRMLGISVGLCSDFFTYHSILLFLAPALVGTPVGFAILGLSMLVSLCIYTSLYRKSFIRSLVPHFEQYEENQKIVECLSFSSEKELECFKEKQDHRLQQEEKRVFGKEKVFGENEAGVKIGRSYSAPNLRIKDTINLGTLPYLRPRPVADQTHPEITDSDCASSPVMRRQ